MAGMTAAQTTAELKRKVSLGIKPTSAANNAQYNKIVANNKASSGTSSNSSSSSKSGSGSGSNKYKASMSIEDAVNDPANAGIVDAITNRKNVTVPYAPGTEGNYIKGPVTESGLLPDNGESSYNYNSSSGAGSNRSSLRLGKELAKLYDIDYDEDAILKKFQNSTTAEYGALNKEYQNTENKFYDQMHATQDTALDTIRRANAAAVATGASRGMQAANELSSILGLQQESVANSTELAAQRNLLKDKEAAAKMKNVVDAMTTANGLKTTLAGLGANLYAADTQFDVGQLDLQARLDAAEKALQGVKETAEATKYDSDNDYKGTVYNADKNYDANKYNADRNYDSTVYNANKNYAAQKLLASVSGKTGGSSGGGSDSYNKQDYLFFQEQFNKAYQAGDYRKLVEIAQQLNPKKDYNQIIKDIQGDPIFMAKVNGPNKNDPNKIVETIDPVTGDYTITRGDRSITYSSPSTIDALNKMLDDDLAAKAAQMRKNSKGASFRAAP